MAERDSDPSPAPSGTARRQRFTPRLVTEAWPPLPLDEWADTYATLHMMTQIVGKVRLAHGWTLDGISVLDMKVVPGMTEPEAQYTVFHPSEVELQESVAAVLARVVEERPTRVVLDSLTEMRLLARDPLRFRRQVMALKKFFAEQSITVLMLETVKLMGAMTLADRVRPHAAQALRALHESGIRRVVMVTGDNEAVAMRVAAELGEPGVDEVHSGLLPEDKVALVHKLRGTGTRVLMVGDGVNDAPALAAADVGVAMGSAGTDVALETADIALMADDLTKLPEAVRFARKAERIIRANIAVSLLTKAAFLALAVAGVATLWMAVVADMGASLLVQ